MYQGSYLTKAEKWVQIKVKQDEDKFAAKAAFFQVRPLKIHRCVLLTIIYYDSSVVVYILICWFLVILDQIWNVIMQAMMSWQ